MISGDDIYEIREQKIEGATDTKWWWAKTDTGAWIGPVEDWNESHYHKYFNKVQSRKVVVTAGGNMGLHTRAYSEMFERVFVFEPDTINFHALVRNNHADNVFFFKAALGKAAGWCHLNNSSQTTNMGMHTVEANEFGKVPMMAIDSLRLPACDLIQLDVEGYEYDALVGAKSTIEQHSPVIITEGNKEIVIKYLAQLGYENTEPSSKSDFIYTKKQE